MGTSERMDPRMGPFVNFAQMYCNGLELWARQSMPILKSVGRCNLEMMGLATRWARAWAEFPSRLRDCKGPQDVAREQLNFWQTAAQDYAQSTQRVTLAFASLALSAAGDAKVATARDYITFSEDAPAQGESPRERRAA